VSTPADEGFIVHTERRMHLPELSEHCVTCLRERLAEVSALLPEVLDALDCGYEVQWATRQSLRKFLTR